MKSITRAIVTSPMVKTISKAGVELDLVYLSKNIIISSGPTSYSSWIRYPLTTFLEFLESEHDEEWWIWNLKEDDPGYLSEEVDNKVSFYPFPDHQPPPLYLMKNIVLDIDNFLHPAQTKDNNTTNSKRVAVVHCKAGKGRSGTIGCAYLMYDRKMSASEVMQLYTSKRMHEACGQGISIKSQIRYLEYWQEIIQTNQIDKILPEGKIFRITNISVSGINPPIKFFPIEFNNYISWRKGVEIVNVFKCHFGEFTKTNQDRFELETDFKIREDVQIVIMKYNSLWFNCKFYDNCFYGKDFDSYKMMKNLSIELKIEEVQNINSN